MNFKEENSWLAAIRLEIENGGDSSFYKLIEAKLDKRTEAWRHIDEGGDFNSNELTKLIQSASGVKGFMEQRRSE